jgi:hypothetical protein
MIDPKLNEIPGQRTTAADRQAAETESTDRQKRGRAGLSINDTVAGDTLLSSGARGVDTSGVAAGSGAGAGSQTLTVDRPNESPAPHIVSGARGSGTTVRGGVNPTDLAESPSTNVSDGTPRTTPNTLEVAQRAYHIWCSKGCPEGTADEDWIQAERELSADGSGAWARAAGR